MSIAWSRELKFIYRKAEAWAEEAGQPLSSDHLLLALLTFRSHASGFLARHRVTIDSTLEALSTRREEPPATVQRLLQRAEALAGSVRASSISSQHLLMAMISNAEASAFHVIAEVLGSLTHFRSELASTLSTEAIRPRPDLSTEEQEKAPHVPRRPSARLPRISPMGRSLAERVHEQDRIRVAQSMGHRPQRPMPLPPSVSRQRKPGARTSTTDTTAPTSERQPRAPAPLSNEQASREAGARREEYQLDESRYPTLAQLGRNLTLAAFDGQLDPVLGRAREIEQLVDVLNKRRTNNAVLLGDPGVGKTAIVEGLARVMAGLEIEAGLRGLEGRLLIELEPARLLSGTGVRGALEERIQKIRDEVRDAQGRIILFLDELHAWLGGEGGSDVASEFKTALARGELPCVGATTWAEHRRYIAPDAALARRFQVIRVEEPDDETCLQVVRSAAITLAEHHEVTFDEEALDLSVRLTRRYLPEERLPDKALSLLDMAGSRARRSAERRVSPSRVARLVAERAGLPAERLLISEQQRFVELDQQLAQRIVGHADAITRVSSLLRRNFAGFATGRPIGSLLFLGPTGVGKTEFAKAMASVLFDDAEAMIRIDMSELLEAHSVSRLIGAPPGYVGHETGGQLTEAIRRRPWTLVLFDELEKAHPAVLNLLLQILEEGTLTDSQGRAVTFRHCVVVMTSNLGAEAFSTKGTRRAGFGQSHADADRQDARAQVLDAARGALRPEIWNRIDEKLVFGPLDRQEVRTIARKLLLESSQRLAAERGFGYRCSEDVVEFLLEAGGFDPTMGARPMRRTIEHIIETRIAEAILHHPSGEDLHVVVERGTIQVLREPSHSERSQEDAGSSAAKSR